MIETPKEAARRLSAHIIAKGSKPIALHEYTGTEGNAIYWRIRAKHPETGEKWIRPMKLNGAGFELGEPKFESGKPLYMLHRIASNPDVIVWFVEGENKADALNNLGLVASTSGGATSADGADWQPLRGRTVNIWPDNDEPGKTYAGDVTNILLGMGCAVTCVDVGKLGLPDKGDAVDWLRAHPGAAGCDIESLPLLTPSPVKENSPAASLDAPASDAQASLFDGEGRKKSQATVLVDLSAPIKLFHDADSTCYAIIQKPTHREVWPVQSRAFRNWLSHEYFVLSGQGARGASVADALATVEARAQHQSEQREVFQRVAWLGDKIVIDLADAAWRVVEIDAAGWRILDQSPVMFTRRTGMAPLPTPVSGCLLDILKFINVSPDDKPLIIGWLLMAARGRGPYPVLILNGEQGTGKSSTTRALRSAIDPSTVPLRGLTRDVRDLLVTATNNHVIVSDNLSGLSAELSDVFCRLSTGGGFAERQLYSNRDEVLVNIQRPIVLNGIDEVATRGDLMERSLIINLPHITETAREAESVFWKRFDAALPGILGGMCDALSCAIKNQHTVNLAHKPRMADFALWVTAAEPALGWESGTFMQAYSVNQDAGVEVALEASPFGEALLKFMAGDRKSWSGTATDLLNELEHTAHERAIRSQSWPKSGKGAASALRRLSPLFRRMKITIEQQHREAGTGRRIVMIDSSGFSSSQPSHRHKPNNRAGSSRDGSVTQIQPTVTTVTPSSHPNPISGAVCDERDGRDAKNCHPPTHLRI